VTITARHRKSRSSTKARPRVLSVYDGRTAMGAVIEHAPEDWEARTVRYSIGHFPNCKAAADAVSDASASEGTIGRDGRADGPARKRRQGAGNG
jgi:hypothetical protein